MSLWTSLEPASATVDPGSSTRVQLRIRNTGDVVDEYRFEPVGDLAPWTTVEPHSVRLYPGTTGTVQLTFSPPRTPDATAGPNPYAVRITPTEHPDAVTVPEGNLTVTPFTEVRAELVPPVVKGRFRGRPRLAVDNIGNTKVTASLSGSDTGDRLSYDIRPGNLQIEPGRAAFVKTTLKPRQVIWFGSKEEQPYALTLRRSGAESVDVDGTYVQRGFLPGWLATGLGLLLTLLIAFVVIWMSYKPDVRSAATAQSQKADAGVIAPPPISSAPSPPTPSEEPVAESPTAEAEAEAEAGAEGAEDAGGGASKEAKAPERTAATALREVVARSAGRHICYRAYVAGEGWQDPVCDGAEAGTVGKGLPIKALNIAASGTEGVRGQPAYLVDHWVDPWATKADGEDLVLGSTKEADPPLIGFTIQVLDKSVCAVAHVKDLGWMNKGCTGPADYAYMGDTMGNNRQLEAVKLTV